MARPLLGPFDLPQAVAPYFFIDVYRGCGFVLLGNGITSSKRVLPFMPLRASATVRFVQFTLMSPKLASVIVLPTIGKPNVSDCLLAMGLFKDELVSSWVG